MCVVLNPIDLASLYLGGMIETKLRRDRLPLSSLASLGDCYLFWLFSLDVISFGVPEKTPHLSHGVSFYDFNRTAASSTNCSLYFLYLESKIVSQ
jgi:hypothetical protein